MKILFISHFYRPHIGGVEKHIERIADRLKSRGNTVKIITEKHDKKLRTEEIRNKVKIYRISYPKFKIIGLLRIWYEIFKLRHLIFEADIIHIHDVFIWYLPFRFLYPKKKVFLTIHGLEWSDPFNKWSLLQKRLAVKLSHGSIGVGKFLEKYIGAKFDEILYGGMERLKDLKKFRTPEKNTIVFVGRLEPDTGLAQFLEYLFPIRHSLLPIFVGDGSLRKKCAKFGKVHGFCNSEPFYKKAETVVPSGYLTYLEAKSYGCKIMTFYGTNLKKEYWEEILRLKKFDSWEGVTDKYIKLWNK